jgi:hypothetical protein
MLFTLGCKRSGKQKDRKSICSSEHFLIGNPPADKYTKSHFAFHTEDFILGGL